MNVSIKKSVINFNHRAARTVALGSALLALGAGASFGTEPRSYVARAFDLESSAVLYTEHHREIWSDGRLVGGLVEYRDPAGETFARKELDFEISKFAPSFRMVDERDGFEEGASWDQEGLQLFASRGEDEQQALIPTPPEEAVIDAGFHRYMQENLSALAAGGRAEFSFAVPSLGRFLRFRVETLPTTDDNLVRLKMRPANAFLRLLVDPIELVYHQDGRLLEFIGLTNIPDAEGERHLARIVFDYPDADSEVLEVASAG